MTEPVEFKSRVGSDGVLNLRLLLGEAVAGADVVVTVRPVSKTDAAPELDPSEWHRFVDETYGSCADLGLERQSQSSN